MKAAHETDWSEIQRRLDAVRVAVEQGFTPSLQEEKRLLRGRARELAREQAGEAPAESALEIVEFELAGERYGFELARVREVCHLKEVTPVPCTPPFVLGIMNLRGEIRTVIDLRKVFELPEQGIGELNKVILIHHGDLQLGVLADAIRGVRTIALEEMQPALPTLTGRRADYLRGIAPERLVILDAAAILSDPRLVVDDQLDL